MKKTSILLAAAFGLALAGTAQAQDEGNGIEASMGVDAVSAYVFRGGTINDEINLNPYLEASIAGVTIGTWGNFNTDTTQFDEIDYYVGYDLPLEDSPVSISIGYTEYTFPTAVDSGVAVAEDGTETEVITGGTEADREVSISFGLDDVPGSPSLGVYYGIEGPFLDEGLYLELGAGHSVNLTEDNALDLGVAIGYEAGDNFEENGFSHATLSAGTGIGSASISLNYVIEIDDEIVPVDEDFYISVGVGL